MQINPKCILHIYWLLSFPLQFLFTRGETYFRLLFLLNNLLKIYLKNVTFITVTLYVTNIYRNDINAAIFWTLRFIWRMILSEKNRRNFNAIRFYEFESRRLFHVNFVMQCLWYLRVVVQKEAETRREGRILVENHKFFHFTCTAMYKSNSGN